MESAKQIVDSLGLEPHQEGGFFRRTYTSQLNASIGPERSDRPTLTCIYYMLTSDSPIGRLHVNRSDIVHFFHSGGPIEYTLVSPNGELRATTLGPDIEAGHQLQLAVPGGWWKASELKASEYGLISEAVSPGFDYGDMNFVTKDGIAARFPSLAAQLLRFVSNR